MKLYRRDDGTVTTNEDDGELILDLNYERGPHPNGTGLNFQGDQITVDCVSPDTGPCYVQFGGHPTGSVGFNWKVDGNTFQFRYQVRAGDSLQKIADGVRAAVTSNSALNDWLASIDFQIAMDGRTNSFAFNVPWGPNSSFTPVGTGVSLSYNPRLDNNPFLNIARAVPGRAPMAGDQIGSYRADGQSTADSWIDTQYGKIQTYIEDVSDPSNPVGAISIGTANGVSGRVAYQGLFISKGVCMPGNDGSGNRYMPWPGHGNVGTYGLYFHPHNPSNPPNGFMWVDTSGRLWIRLNGQNKQLG